jgi:hypothetical protein
MDTPQHGWFTTEDPILKWMIWGYPHENPPLHGHLAGSSTGRGGKGFGFTWRVFGKPW